MILYLDASALVKRYVAEFGSAEVGRTIAQARVVGTALVSRAEVAAALAKAARTEVLSEEEARAAFQVLGSDWPDLVKMQATETLVARAGELAWAHGLRGYEAVHLAAASIWQDVLGEEVTLATFDRRLWEAGKAVGLRAFPAELPAGREHR